MSVHLYHPVYLNYLEFFQSKYFKKCVFAAKNLILLLQKIERSIIQSSKNSAQQEFCSESLLHIDTTKEKAAFVLQTAMQYINQLNFEISAVMNEREINKGYGFSKMVTATL